MAKSCRKCEHGTQRTKDGWGMVAGHSSEEYSLVLPRTRGAGSNRLCPQLQCSPLWITSDSSPAYSPSSSPLSP